MTKEQILEKFQEQTNHWPSCWQVKRYAKILKKSECEKLLSFAKHQPNHYQFRLFEDHGYVLDSCYNRFYIYDRRK